MKNKEIKNYSWILTKRSELLGLKVRRGPDWNYRDQDGGAGLEGTIVVIRAHQKCWVRVNWDCAHSNIYRIGRDFSSFDPRKFYMEVEPAEDGVELSIEDWNDEG